MENKNNRPKAQQIYRHFKGNLYQIQCIASHSETGEEMVVYQALYGDFRFFVRPLSMFMEKVDRVKYPNATQEYRFEAVNEPVGNGFDNTLPVESSSANNSDIVNPSNSTAPSPIVTAKDEVTAQAQTGTGEDAFELDEDVVRFLDADTYEQRIDILTGMQYKITDEMITIMATVIDIEVKSGDIHTRYEDFKKSLMIRKHYEGVRLR